MWRWPITFSACRARQLTGQILQESERLRKEDSRKLRERAEVLQWQARTGRPLQQLMIRVYALTREAARRSLGSAHYPVQVYGGVLLFGGRVIEMQTGEGKTLTAALPVSLRALQGQGCHVVTVNDYVVREGKVVIVDESAKTRRPSPTPSPRSAAGYGFIGFLKRLAAP